MPSGNWRYIVIRKIIAKDLLRIFRHAEKVFGKGMGRNKLSLATELILLKYRFLKPFSKQVERVIKAEFEIYKKQINKQIMTVVRVI